MLKFEQLDVDANDVLGVEYFDGCEKNLSITLPSARNRDYCISQWQTWALQFLKLI